MTPGGQMRVYNPFESPMLERLHNQLDFSPNMFVETIPEEVFIIFSFARFILIEFIFPLYQLKEPTEIPLVNWPNGYVTTSRNWRKRHWSPVQVLLVSIQIEILKSKDWETICAVKIPITVSKFRRRSTSISRPKVTSRRRRGPITQRKKYCTNSLERLVSAFICHFH